MNSVEPQIIKSLSDDIQGFGLKGGDIVIVHSSFKALGLQDSTPADVIHTLLSVLGANGTLMMPTFTYSYAGIRNVQPFNPEKTIGIKNGILSETLRQHPKALRSGHPTYSVAVIGKHAAVIAQGREKAVPLGRGSSFEVAISLGARILLIGVGNKYNSALHYAEVAADLPYNDIPFREFWGRTALLEKSNRVIEVTLPNEFPGCSTNFNVVDEYLDSKGLLTHGRICDADSMLMNANDMIGMVVSKLRECPAWLLCDSFVCEPCTLRKRRLQEKKLI